MVSIEELPNWIDKIVEEQVGPERQKAEMFRNRINSTIDEIRNIADRLLEENVRQEIGDVSEPVLTAANKLGSRILSLAESVKAPDPVTYDALADSSRTLNDFKRKPSVSEPSGSESWIGSSRRKSGSSNSE